METQRRRRSNGRRLHTYVVRLRRTEQALGLLDPERRQEAERLLERFGSPLVIDMVDFDLSGEELAERIRRWLPQDGDDAPPPPENIG